MRTDKHLSTNGIRVLHIQNEQRPAALHWPPDLETPTAHQQPHNQLASYAAIAETNALSDNKGVQQSLAGPDSCTTRSSFPLTRQTSSLKRILQHREPLRASHYCKNLLKIDDSEQIPIHTSDQAFESFDGRVSSPSFAPYA